MPTDLYCTAADLPRYGLPRGRLANPGRLIALAYAATDVLELDAHGFGTDTALLFRAEAGGSLPAPLVAGTTYYAISLSDSTFQVAATAGGAAINLTTAGESVLVTAPLPVDETIEFYSRFVDSHLPAHLVPLEAPIPPIVVGIVAQLSSARLLHLSGQTSVSMPEIEAGAHKELERWAKGLPIRDTRMTAAANLSVAEGVVADPRGWSSSGGCIP